MGLCRVLAQDGQGTGGSLSRMNGFLVLHVKGTAEQMGEQHGRLLRSQVRRVIRDLIDNGEAAYPTWRKRLMDGSRTMEGFLPAEYRAELRALAQAAGVGYEKLVVAQLFGDVNRTMYSSAGSAPECSAFAAFGPATETGECIVGRNMDYWDYGVSRYGAVLIHFAPAKGYRFFIVTWAGIINGWTAMNEHGVVVANNTAYGAKHSSRAGVSTCFVLRKAVQYGRTVEEAVDIIRKTRRSCGTNMIVAGGQRPNAAIVEYDHKNVLVRWAKDGFVYATNDFRKLYQTEPTGFFWECSRYKRLGELIRTLHGRINREMNFMADPGVTMSINLHSALLFPSDLRFRVSMGKQPATDGPYQSFRMTRDGLVAE